MKQRSRQINLDATIGEQPRAQPADWLVQRKLDAVLGDISAGEHGSGYVSGRTDLTSTTITVFWHGTVPAFVRDRLAQAARTGVTVTVESAAFSADELAATRGRALGAMRSSDLGVSIVADQPDGVGFTVGLTTAEQLRAANEAIARIGAADAAGVDYDAADAPYAALYSPPGTPPIVIDPVPWASSDWRTPVG